MSVGNCDGNDICSCNCGGCCCGCVLFLFLIFSYLVICFCLPKIDKVLNADSFSSPKTEMADKVKRKAKKVKSGELENVE